MSIELHIKMRGDTVPVEVFAALVSERLFGFAEAGTQVTDISDIPRNMRFGAADRFVDLSIGDEMQVGCICYTAGPEVLYGEEGGWWVCVGLANRNKESFLLMLVAAASLAVLVNSEVVDDTNLLHFGRCIKPEELFKTVEQLRQPTFSGTAIEVAKKFGFMSRAAQHDAVRPA